VSSPAFALRVSRGTSAGRPGRVISCLGRLMGGLFQRSCATRCTSQGKGIEINLRCIDGFCTEAELLQRRHHANDVAKMTCEAAWHYAVRLLSSRCATRGTCEGRKGTLHFSSHRSSNPFHQI